ncbi:MAG: hypothetical protein U1E05_22000 [Patescibacteria group bacterium]|nr:hypothetical protein [Patescibacteria group bacterium]
MATSIGESGVIVESDGSTRQPRDRAVIHVHASRRVVLGFALLLLVPWAVLLLLAWTARDSMPSLPPTQAQGARASVTGHPPIQPNRPPVARPAGISTGAAVANGRIELGKAGRWGRLEYTRIAIELPEEFVYVPPATADRMVRWFFKGFTREQFVALVESIDMEGELREKLLAAPNESEPDGIWVTPGDEVILALKPEARAALYSILVGFKENSLYVDPFCYRPSLLNERLERSGLTDQALGLFQSLLYPHGPSLLLFADVEPALRQIADETEQRRFVKTVSRRTTLLASLQITPESNIAELVGYWGVGGRSKDLEPLLDSLRRVEGGTKLDVLHLLPRFVRQRLYTYPQAVDEATVSKQDCFWSAFNMFNDEPDDRFADMNYAAEVLQTDYNHIVSPSQLGDLIFLATEDGTAVHAATYIADNIVFTKNGAMYTQPWILMPLDDMVAIYSIPYPADRPLKVHFYRRASF